MLKTLVLTAAVGIMSALFVADASAMPLAQGKQTIEDSDTTLVADGCGRGMRYSNSRGRCVPQRDADPIAPIIREIIRPRQEYRSRQDCGWGFRFSESRGRCVRT